MSVEAAPSAAALRPRRLSARTLGLMILGLLAIGLLVYQVGVADVAALLATMGARAPLILLPFTAVSTVDAIAWARALPRRSRGLVPLHRLYFTRLAGEAVSNLTPSAGMGGEPLKAFLLKRHGVPTADGVASVVIAKTAVVASQFVFTLMGLLFLAARLGILRDRAPWLLAGAVLTLVISIILVAGQRRGLAVRAVRLLDRLGVRRPFVRRLEEQAKEIDGALENFYRDDPRSFAAATALYMTGWLLGVAEVMLIFYLMDVRCGWPEAVIIESLTQATMAAAAFIPGGLGVQEISGAVLCRFLGIGEAAGTALMLLKRAREVAFTVLGVSMISWLARPKNDAAESPV